MYIPIISAAVVALGLLFASAAQADESCTQPQDVLTYFISEPNSWPDFHPVTQLKGLQAQKLLSVMGYPGALSGVELVIAFESKSNAPDRYFIAIFNADGCALNSKGGVAEGKPGERNGPAGAWISKAQYALIVGGLGI